MEFVSFLFHGVYFSAVAIACTGLAFILEYVVGRLVFALGWHRFGLRCMAMSGMFLSRLPDLCSRCDVVCDGGCGNWTCPVFFSSRVLDESTSKESE